MSDSTTRYAVYHRTGTDRRWKLVDVFDSEDAAWAAALDQPGHVWVHQLTNTVPDPFCTAGPHEVPVR